MTLYCPHCGGDPDVGDPFRLEDEFDCPQCGRRVYLEMGASDGGPTFTLYREPPGSELYPPG